jgi:SulP family sulfate permease
LLHKIFPFLTWLPLVTKNTLKADLIAGLTGAVIVLPQGVAFASIAGLPPEYGLYTAMVTPVIAAFFGSSFHLISGPTTAISIVVYSAISHYAPAGSPEFIHLALTLTFLAGIYQLAFGLARLGTLVNFVSHTVVIGFTAGAAILIATSQMKHALGISIPKGGTFLGTWLNLFEHISATNYYVLTVALITLVIAILTRRIWPRSPYLLFGMLAGSITSIIIGGETHGVSLVGEIPSHLPPLSSPDFNFATIKQLAPEAFAIALLGLIEAVSISRAIASRSHQKIDGNQEFIGQGLSNLVGSFFSSYAGSGSFTRSGINYSAGAKTPVSAVFAAIFLVIIVLLVAPLTAYLPIASMGGVILIVAYNLIDFKHIVKIVKLSKTETSILLVTFLATLFLELEFAIYMGVLLSLVIFLSRTSTPDIIVLAPDHDSETKRLTNVKKTPLFQCPQIKILRIDMSIYFGSLNYIQNKLQAISDNEHIHHILIIGSSINFIDLSGAEMLEKEAHRLKAKNGGLYFSGLKSKTRDFLEKGHFIDDIGRENFFSHKKHAIATITQKLNRSICQSCNVKIFSECDALAKELPIQEQDKPQV